MQEKSKGWLKKEHDFKFVVGVTKIRCAEMQAIKKGARNCFRTP